MIDWLDAVVVLAVLTFSAGLGSVLTAAILRLAARSGDAGGRYRRPDGEEGPARPDTDATVSDGPTGRRARDTLRGGTWIGILERVAITGSLLAGYPAGIAFVIAVKGLGRYPELRENPGASERFVIGTLTSMIWAVALGGLGRHLIA